MKMGQYCLSFKNIEFFWLSILRHQLKGGWEGTAAMDSAINGSEQPDLQDVTPSPAA